MVVLLIALSFAALSMIKIVLPIALARNFDSTEKPLSFEAREDAYRQNNLGVAQLEQFNPKEAAAHFRRALEIDSKLAIAQINLAIALFNAQEIETARAEAENAVKIAPDRAEPVYISGLIARNQNRADAAVAAFQRVLEIDAQDVGANVNLGQIFVHQRKYAEAVELFRRALAAEPYNATAMYNLGTALLRNNQRDEGQKLIQNFQTLRQSGAATTIGQNYLEQGRYAEAIASTGAETELVDKQAPKISFQIKNVNLQTQKPQTGIANGGFDFLKPKSKYDVLRRFAGGSTLFDFDSDGDMDLIKLNNSIGASRKISQNDSTANVTASISLFRNDSGKFTDISSASGDLARITKNVQTSVVAGDFDNDNLPDLFVTSYGDLRLFRNLGKGKFEDVSARAKLPKYENLSISTAFVDADHDGDLDIFVAGFISLADITDGHKAVFPRDF